ncbi:MAG TPA: energy transducer TonB [Blastocatellia bacterium]|nr:energy transducer TonB [Blastocatellia bacterium]
MFEKLVVSSSQRRRGRTAKFFVCTSLVYLSVVGLAFALSVLLATPKLADTGATGSGPIFLPPGGPGQKPPLGQESEIAPTKDPRNVESLDRIISDLGNPQPPVIKTGLPPGTEPVGALELPPGDGGPGIPGIPGSSGRDVSSSNVITDPPRPPDPPKPLPRATQKVKPLVVSSTVLQGKAIERVVPVYPELPRRIGLKGEVSVEVIISPEGRVESVRVVSGHPMLVTAARDAASRWRFEPTFLNGVAVRVTGVITFVFKLNE